MNIITTQSGSVTTPSFSIKISQVGPRTSNFIAAGTFIDPDFVSWLTAVQATGGTITLANQTAFNNAFLALKNTNAQDGNSLWSHINQGYFFIGQESLTNGLFVPFYNTNTGSGLQPINVSPATNYNFTSYTKKRGLAGDGASTYIDTGIDNSNTTAWPSTSPFRHGYVYLDNGTVPGGGIAGFPFGTVIGGTTGLTARTFQASIYNNTNTVTGRIWNDSSQTAVVNFTQSVIQNGGWGIPITYSAGGQNQTVAAGTGQYTNVATANPVSSGLVQSNILIGRTSQNYSGSNIIAATFGTSITGNDFASIDNIVNNLISQLS